MENAKFTPGPWEHHYESAYIEDGDGSAVAYVDVPKPRLECIANARLIAAAPEMYEALNEVMQLVNHPYSYKARAAAFDKARATLAKAVQL